MNQDDSDSLRDEYDFSDEVRGKHCEAYRAGTNVALLEPDVAKALKDSAFEQSEEGRAFMRAVVAGLRELEAGHQVTLAEVKKRLGLK